MGILNKIEKDGKVYYSFNIKCNRCHKPSEKKIEFGKLFKALWKKMHKEYKPKEDCRIKLSWESNGSYRYYYYKIVPSELPFFKRIFKNPWRRIEKECLDDWNPCFSIREYKEYIVPMQTYGDVKRFEDKEWEKIKARRKRYEELNVRWPD